MLSVAALLDSPLPRSKAASLGGAVLVARRNPAHSGYARTNSIQQPRPSAGRIRPRLAQCQQCRTHRCRAPVAVRSGNHRPRKRSEHPNDRFENAAFFIYEDGGEPESPVFNPHIAHLIERSHSDGLFTEIPCARGVPDGGVVRLFQRSTPAANAVPSTPEEFVIDSGSTSLQEIRLGLPAGVPVSALRLRIGVYDPPSGMRLRIAPLSTAAASRFTLKRPP